METDDDHATIKESFSLVQNILFIEYTDVFPAHLLENIVENGGKLCNLVCFSDIVLWRELLVSLVTWLKPIQECVNCPVSGVQWPRQRWVFGDTAHIFNRSQFDEVGRLMANAIKNSIFIFCALPQYHGSWL